MRAFMCRVLAGVLLAGCAYQPSSFRSDFQAFAGQRSSAGCLDLAVERRPDLPHGDAVLAYAFGNRCDVPVLVDLAAVTVVGREVDGSARSLVVYDPRREVDARWLDGRAVGGETLTYEGSAGLADICVDAGSVARAPITHWLCFASQPQHREVP